MDQRPNIAFSGLTAAGKTTHAKLLAQELGYRYVSAMEVMLKIMKLPDNVDRIWFTKKAEIDAAREGDAFDLELDRQLQVLADSGGGMVFDTWAMGRIYQGPLIRIWLDSDLPSRTRKCFVSQSEESKLNLSGCRELIEKKDTDTKAIFKRLYDFDLFRDLDTYDAIITNTSLIPDATAEASSRGIDAFKPVVRSVADYLIDAATGITTAGAAQKLSAQHHPYILRLNQPWSYH